MGRKVKFEANATVRVFAWIDAPEHESIDDTIERVRLGEIKPEWQHGSEAVVNKSSLDIREEINTKDEASDVQ